MTTIKQDSHVYRLLTFLSYVGEYPLCSLQLFGSKEVWRKLIHKHSQRQEYRIPGHADKIICRLLLITGKGKSKSVRLSKGGQSIPMPPFTIPRITFAIIMPVRPNGWIVSIGWPNPLP